MILGRYDGANKDADTALTEDPLSVPGILAKAEARYHQGSFEHALKYYYRYLIIVKLIHFLVAELMELSLDVKTNIEFIRWFLRIFQETEFVYSFLYTANVNTHQITTFIFVEKIRRFVVTEFVKLSDEFDEMHEDLSPNRHQVT